MAHDEENNEKQCQHGVMKMKMKRKKNQKWREKMKYMKSDLSTW